MASSNKLRKLKNSFMYRSFMKHKQGRLKRLFFYTKAQQNTLKKIETWE